eukprot:TsM_001220400 transcript=TsM_001220400 gene=TsM_001220400
MAFGKAHFAASQAPLSGPLVHYPCRTLPKLEPMSDAPAAGTDMDVNDGADTFATMLCICRHPHLYTKLKSYLYLCLLFAKFYNDSHFVY